jgi:hypothetical protein
MISMLSVTLESYPLPPNSHQDANLLKYKIPILTASCHCRQGEPCLALSLFAVQLLISSSCSASSTVKAVMTLAHTVNHLCSAETLCQGKARQGKKRSCVSIGVMMLEMCNSWWNLIPMVQSILIGWKQPPKHEVIVIEQSSADAFTRLNPKPLAYGTLESVQDVPHHSVHQWHSALPQLSST